MTIRFPKTPKFLLELADRIGARREAETYFRDYEQVIATEFANRAPDTSSRNSIYLTSPDGSVWEVKISDLGVLSATKVFG